jgi:hypothetical protein
MANFFYNKTVALWRNKPYSDHGFLMQYMAHARLSTIKDLTPLASHAMTNEGNEAHRQEIFKTAEFP